MLAAVAAAEEELKEEHDQKCVPKVERLFSLICFHTDKEQWRRVARLSRRTVFVNFEGVRVVRSKNDINII